MKKQIKFKVDFATKKKGDVWICDSQLASQLVTVDKVADYLDSEKPKKEPKTK